jgi:hypothetical protein
MIGKLFQRLAMVGNDPRWLRFYAQRAVLDPRHRDAVADALAKRFRPRPAGPAPADPAHEAAITRHADALGTDGISMLGELLSPTACAEVRAFLAQREVYDPYRDDRPRFLPLASDGRHPDAHIAHHDPVDVMTAPHLVELANDPRIMGVASSFLGCKPTISYLAAWWSYPTQTGAQQAEFFHRDVDDWRFLKLFVYLTDVAADNGPHVYVRASARSGDFRKIRRYTDDEVIQRFGTDAVLTLTAPSGHGFLENTFGIHKGQPVAHAPRLIFQAVYGLSVLPYAPVRPPMRMSEFGRAKLDPWANRVYFA